MGNFRVPCTSVSKRVSARNFAQKPVSTQSSLESGPYLRLPRLRLKKRLLNGEL